MRRNRAALAAAIGVCVARAPLAAQGGGGGRTVGGGGSLTATEVAVGGVAALARRDYWGAGLGLARRVSAQTRFAFVAAAGTMYGNGTTTGRKGAALRLEATGQFLVTPTRRSGAGLYGGAGVAWQTANGDPGTGYLTLLVGLEGAPGRGSGWYTELGLGGGVRVAAGWRWRWFPAWWQR